MLPKIFSQSCKNMCELIKLNVKIERNKTKGESTWWKKYREKNKNERERNNKTKPGSVYPFTYLHSSKFLVNCGNAMQTDFWYDNNCRLLKEYLPLVYWILVLLRFDVSKATISKHLPFWRKKSSLWTRNLLPSSSYKTWFEWYDMDKMTNPVRFD